MTKHWQYRGLDCHVIQNIFSVDVQGKGIERHTSTFVLINGRRWEPLCHAATPQSDTVEEIAQKVEKTIDQMNAVCSMSVR